jgi:hypothetical protein
MSQKYLTSTDIIHCKCRNVNIMHERITQTNQIPLTKLPLNLHTLSPSLAARTKKLRVERKPVGPSEGSLLVKWSRSAQLSLWLAVEGVEDR